MRSKVDRKEAVRQFKDRKPARGTYALRCTGSGRVWVGSSPNLDAARNSSWFCLRNGSHREHALQADWNANGEPTFQHEILETLDEVAPFAVTDLLKEKKSFWLARLGALPLP